MSDSDLFDLPDNQNDIYFQVSDADLKQLLADTLSKNDILQCENKMFQKFIDRTDEKSRALSNSDKKSSSFLETNLTRANKARQSRHRPSINERSVKLTPEQKCEIAETEIEDYQQTIERSKINCDKMTDFFKSTMEEADIRLAEIHKFRYEFDRDVIKGAINPFSNVVMSEKFVRHIEERLRQRDTLIDKLRLKYSSLMQHNNKLKMQLKQKEEMGEVLQEVDFQQLKIENKQYLEKMDEKNKELISLKLTAGRTLQVLNIYKQKLAISMADMNKIKTDISVQQELYKRLKAEIIVVDEEKTKAESINKRLTDQMSNYRVPAVQEYVKCISDTYELIKRDKILERKVDIAKMALNMHKKIWNQTRRTHSTS